MIVSIITVCRNAANTIVETVESVTMQRDIDIEYIIIDGASSDGTQKLISNYSNNIAQFISEPDAGIYDAMNKGLAIASGDLIGFLNADDVLASPDIIARIVKEISRRNADLLFGDVEIYNVARQLKRIYRGRNFIPGNVRRGIIPPHPSLYVRTELMQKVKAFDTTYKIAADYELITRLFYRYSPTWVYLPQTVVRMRAGGVSNQGISSYWTITKEMVDACRKNGVRPNLAAIAGRGVWKSYEMGDAMLHRLKKRNNEIST